MAWTYDPTQLSTSALFQVRMKIGDTDTNRQLLQDEEINFCLSENDDVVDLAAVCAASAVMAKYATKPQSEKVGDITISWGAIFANMQQLIDDLADTGAAAIAGPYVGGISQSDMEGVRSDDDRVKPAFTREMGSYYNDDD